MAEGGRLIYFNSPDHNLGTQSMGQTLTAFLHTVLPTQFSAHDLYQHLLFFALLIIHFTVELSQNLVKQNTQG